MLLAGGVATLLASACCLGPLILLLLGVSGAWIGSLSALEPYRPVFILIAIVALVVAHGRIFRAAGDCEPGAACATPVVNRANKVMFWIAVGLLGIALAFPYAAPLFY